MANVSAPYNFVPLNDQVFFPPWADLVSHDIPFKEGLSGQIKIKITAETPIFIRKPYEEGDEEGSYYKNDKGEKISKEFCHIKTGEGRKRYYIPGSSIKGMLRSITEILSFSKINFLSEVLNDRKPYRDMANPELYDIRGDKNIRIGWLLKTTNDNIIIKDGRELGDLRNRNNINTVFRPDNYHNRDYDFFEDITNEEYSTLCNTSSLEEKYSIYNKYYYSASDFEEMDDEEVIVLTGNIENKRHEFIFPIPDNCENEIPISNELFNTFSLANQDSNNWSFWRNKFNNNQPVPVFFRTDKQGNVKDFGLVVLYKWLYRYSPAEIINRQQSENTDQRYDLAQLIFGDIQNEKLKGRVQIGHAFSNNAVPENRDREFILGEPKETYYPYYLEQSFQIAPEITGNYSTYSDENARISGRKRYPVHQNFNPNQIKPNPPRREQPNNERVKTYFKPLRSGAEFETIINYHNLLPIELGALLSALTFHGQEGMRHNIGLAKPYGFGKIKIEIQEIINKDNNVSKDNLPTIINGYLCKFERIMDNFLNGDWIKSDEIFQLMSMAYNLRNQNSRKLKYNDLTEFSRIKNERKALPRYSSFMPSNPNLISKCNTQSS